MNYTKYQKEGSGFVSGTYNKSGPEPIRKDYSVSDPVWIRLGKKVLRSS
jgi:hypothetical protein